GEVDEPLGALAEAALVALPAGLADEDDGDGGEAGDDEQPRGDGHDDAGDPVDADEPAQRRVGDLAAEGGGEFPPTGRDGVAVAVLAARRFEPVEGRRRPTPLLDGGTSSGP